MQSDTLLTGILAILLCSLVAYGVARDPSRWTLTRLLDILLCNLVCLAFMVSFPLNFIIWGIYNRKTVNPWMSMTLVVLSLVQVLLQTNFYSAGRGFPFKTWLIPSTFISILFLSTRFVLSWDLKKKWKKILAFTTYVVLIPMTLLVGIPMILYSVGVFSSTLLISIISIVVTALLWVGLLVFLFIKYPKDPLGLIMESSMRGELVFLGPKK